MLMSSAESFNLLLDRLYINQPEREKNRGKISKLLTFKIGHSQKCLTVVAVDTTVPLVQLEYE